MKKKNTYDGLKVLRRKYILYIDMCNQCGYDVMVLRLRNNDYYLNEMRYIRNENMWLVR